MDDLDELLIDEIAMDGSRRCANYHRKGTSVLFPDARGKAWSSHILEHHRTKVAPGQVTARHHELLKRADALLRFLDSNVGGSEEFPLQLYAESYETLEVFNEQLDRVRAAVGILTEV